MKHISECFLYFSYSKGDLTLLTQKEDVYKVFFLFDVFFVLLII